MCFNICGLIDKRPCAFDVIHALLYYYWCLHGLHNFDILHVYVQKLLLRSNTYATIDYVPNQIDYLGKRYMFRG